LKDDEGMEAAKLEGVHSGLAGSDCGLHHLPQHLNPHARQCNSARRIFVIRGGAWDDRALRSAIRSGSDLDDRINDLGFRVARTVD
jgi:formylglycine-generating enzyme required for sulfatase activity